MNKCSNCNQEIVDNKTFCPNCGKKLKDDKYSNINPGKTFAIVIIVMLLLGVGTMYLIANVGLDSQLKKIIDDDTSINSEFNGSYLIKDVITSDQSIEEIKEDIIGFEIELNDSKFKVGLFQILWATIENPTITDIDDMETHKEKLNITTDDYKGIRIEGINSEKEGTLKDIFELIKIDDVVFLHYNNSYFQLELSDYGFDSTDTFYKIQLVDKKYNKAINNEIDKLNKHIKDNVEKQTNEIYIESYEEYKDGDVTHLVVKESDAYINSGIYTNIISLSFNDETGIKYDLNSYLEHKGLSFEEITSKYDQLKEIKYQSSVDEVIEKYSIKPTSTFYVIDNKIYILCGTNQWGMIFLDIEL